MFNLAACNGGGSNDSETEGSSDSSEAGDGTSTTMGPGTVDGTSTGGTSTGGTSTGETSTGGTSTSTGEETETETEGLPVSEGTAWFFGADPATNRWTVTVVDPTDPALVVAEMDLDDLATLSGPEPMGNGAGPNWGDPVTGTDGSRIFVNARSIAVLAVFETSSFQLESVLDVGASPLHIFNPNHGTEIWTHADGPGAFYVVDQDSLSVSDPVVAGSMGGHGKLLYAEQLGTKYYATQVNDPGAFAIDGDTRTVGPLIELCGQPCDDDPMQTCGGTHYKAYNPAANYAIFQCSGAAAGYYAFVDASTDTVVADLVPISGGVAQSDGWEYTLIVDPVAGVQIWDTGAAGHDPLVFDGVAAVPGSPYPNGAGFHVREDGVWEAWLPQSTGTAVALVDLSTYEMTEEIEVGPLSPPPGAPSVNRQGILGGHWYFTYSDDGIVVIDLETHEVIQGPATPTVIQRVGFASPRG